MEALKLKATTSNGILTVAVPEAFNNKEVEIIVLSSENTETGSSDIELTKEKQEQVKRLLSVIGTAKYPEKSINKYDAYEQL